MGSGMGKLGLGVAAVDEAEAEEEAAILTVVEYERLSRSFENILVEAQAAVNGE